MNLYVIREDIYYLADQHTDIIAVVSSVDEAWRIIKKYYGDYDTIDFRDIRDSGIEFQLTIFDKICKQETNITLLEYTVNEI